MSPTIQGIESEIITVTSQEGLQIDIGTEDPNYQGFYVAEIHLTLAYSGNLLYDDSRWYSFYVDITVLQETTYEFCHVDDGGTGHLSPTLDLCQVFFSSAEAASLDCPPASGSEICIKLTKYDEF